MQASLNRLMQKFSATVQVKPHDYLNQAFGWNATFEWGDLPSQQVQVSGVNPEAALQGLTVVVTAKFAEEEAEEELNRLLRASESRHGA